MIFHLVGIQGESLPVAIDRQMRPSLAVGVMKQGRNFCRHLFSGGLFGGSPRLSVGQIDWLIHYSWSP